jgi:general secretion pathway protein L
LIAAILPIAKNYWIASQYRSDIQAMSSEVMELKELRSEFQAVRKKAEQARQLSSKNISLIELLDELTKIIPDDTSLARFSVDENIVRIQGSSTSASKLIAILDASEDFNEVDFVAPVTKNTETDKDNFTIQIKLNLFDENASDQ